MIAIKAIIHVLALFYVINGIMYFIGILILLSRRSKGKLGSNETPMVSVIVPARNEATTIKLCLESLLSQEYPTEKLQIIAVNDGSIDETQDILEEVAHTSSNMKTVHIPGDDSIGKLHALDEGIQKASGEIILTTDADVEVGKNWVLQMVNQFNTKTGIVMGMTVDKYTFSPLMAFQALDGAGIRVVSAVLALFKFPITCQGANLAFRKAAYMQVRESVLHLGKTKGNREWLLQEVKNETDWGIMPIVHPHSFGITQSPSTWSGMINQRSRWASTGKNYSSVLVKIYLGLIFMSILSFISIIFILPVPEAAHILLVKAIIDFSVALGVVTIICQPILIIAFPIAFILQPFFIIISGVLGTLNIYKWK